MYAVTAATKPILSASAVNSCPMDASEIGGIAPMRERFYSVEMVRRRDELVAKLRRAMSGGPLPLPDAPWVTSTLELAAGAREQARRQRSETLVVVQSSKSAADMARVADMEEAGLRSPSRHHLVPNRWHSAWLTDNMRDFTHGPSCAHLPAFAERR